MGCSPGRLPHVHRTPATFVFSTSTLSGGPHVLGPPGRGAGLQGHPDPTAWMGRRAFPNLASLVLSHAGLARGVTQDWTVSPRGVGHYSLPLLANPLPSSLIIDVPVQY